MKTTLPRALLTASLTAQLILPIPLLAENKGLVEFTLEWHSGQQIYTYIFSGVVSRGGRPCSNARIKLQLTASRGDELIQETVALADGSYELKVALEGTPQDMTDWKLLAQAPEFGAEAAEIEGRSILPETENTVVVQRPFSLVRG